MLQDKLIRLGVTTLTLGSLVATGASQVLAQETAEAGTNTESVEESAPAESAAPAESTETPAPAEESTETPAPAEETPAPAESTETPAPAGNDDLSEDLKDMKPKPGYHSVKANTKEYKTLAEVEEYAQKLMAQLTPDNELLVSGYTAEEVQPGIFDLNVFVKDGYRISGDEIVLNEDLMTSSEDEHNAAIDAQDDYEKAYEDFYGSDKEESKEEESKEEESKEEESKEEESKEESKEDESKEESDKEDESKEEESDKKESDKDESDKKESDKDESDKKESDKDESDKKESDKEEASLPYRYDGFKYDAEKKQFVRESDSKVFVEKDGQLVEVTNKEDGEVIKDVKKLPAKHIVEEVKKNFNRKYLDEAIVKTAKGMTADQFKSFSDDEVIAAIAQLMAEGDKSVGTQELTDHLRKVYPDRFTDNAKPGKEEDKKEEETKVPQYKGFTYDKDKGVYVRDADKKAFKFKDGKLYEVTEQGDVKENGEEAKAEELKENAPVLTKKEESKEEVAKKDNGKAGLPETGEASQYAIFGAAALSILGGLGLVGKSVLDKKED